jgi:hypothetical protein
MRVLARDESGALIFDGKRFTTVSGAEAKTQLLRERLTLEPGDDRRHPLRGPGLAALKRAGASPSAFAAVVAEELRLSPHVAAVTAAPAVPPTRERQFGTAVVIEARVVLTSDDGVVTLGVPVG